MVRIVTEINARHNSDMSSRLEKVKAKIESQLNAGLCTERVYFILDKYSDAVKIGVARDPIARLFGLQTGNPRELEILFCVPGNRSVEQLLHRAFREHGIRGEWFILSEISEKIYSLKKFLDCLTATN